MVITRLSSRGFFLQSQASMESMAQLVPKQEDSPLSLSHMEHVRICCCTTKLSQRRRIQQGQTKPQWVRSPWAMGPCPMGMAVPRKVGGNRTSMSMLSRNTCERQHIAVALTSDILQVLLSAISYIYILVLSTPPHIRHRCLVCPYRGTMMMVNNAVTEFG